MAGTNVPSGSFASVLDEEQSPSRNVGFGPREIFVRTTVHSSLHVLGIFSSRAVNCEPCTRFFFLRRRGFLFLVRCFSTVWLCSDNIRAKTFAFRNSRPLLLRQDALTTRYCSQHRSWRYRKRSSQTRKPWRFYRGYERVGLLCCRYRESCLQRSRIGHALSEGAFPAIDPCLRARYRHCPRVKRRGRISAGPLVHPFGTT